MTTELDKSINRNEASPIVTFFPIVCYIKELTDLNELNTNLEKFVLLEAEQSKSHANGSIVGGYHSNRSFLDIDDEHVKAIRKIILENAMLYLDSYWKNESSFPLDKMNEFKLKLSSWSVILKAGNISAPHIHPRSILSGVYYVTGVDEAQENVPGAGHIVLQDPRLLAASNPIKDQPANIMIPPKAGKIVMFPSYVQHYVLPFSGNGTRISIAFNIGFSNEALGAA